MYSEINTIHKTLLTESKQSAKALHLKWSELKEFKRTAWKRYEEGRDRLRAEAWKLLEGLKSKYDEVFNVLEERIKARFRARKPRNRSLGISVTLAVRIYLTSSREV